MLVGCPHAEAGLKSQPCDSSRFIPLAGGFVTSLPVGPLSRYLVLLQVVGPTCVAAGPGPELTSSHGGSRCVTTTVPVSDSGESALVALRAQGLRYTWQVACILTADLGLRAVPTILYCVGLHNSWQGMPWSTSQWTAPWRSTQRLSWQENSSPTYFTSQLRNGSGAFTPTTGEGTHPREGCNNHRGQRRPCWTCSTGSGHRNTNHTTYQGDIVQHTLRNTWQASILKTVLAPEISD